ncbi:MAG: nitroreductase family protein [Acidimicrobiia bacterium]
MELDYVMRTTPATRTFTDDPVPDDVLYDILEVARFAPNGGNRQGWKVIVVRDQPTKDRINELYDLGFREYAGFMRAGLVPFQALGADKRDREPIDLEEARNTPLDAPQSLIAQAPVLLVIVLDLENVSAVDAGLGRLSISAGGSVYPFAHNILLAARNRGFGGHVTSVLARQEPALRELLGIPENYILATMLPIGKPPKEITKLRRIAVEEFTSIGRFDGPPLTK